MQVSETPPLTCEERKLVVAAVDNWLEGLEAARQLTTQDATIPDAETLLDLVSGYDEDHRALLSAREKLSGSHSGTV